MRGNIWIKDGFAKEGNEPHKMVLFGLVRFQYLQKHFQESTWAPFRFPVFCAKKRGNPVNLAKKKFEKQKGLRYDMIGICEKAHRLDPQPGAAHVFS